MRPIRLSRPSTRMAAFAAAATVAAAIAAAPATAARPTSTAVEGAAPYLYLGWGDPPDPRTVMQSTGVRGFTLAFILSTGGCEPGWDGQRPLQGGADAATIRRIQDAGGFVIPSIGGWSGNKLGPNCPSDEALAGAYQKVIDAYGLTAIDIDIENTDEFESEVVQDRILGALRIVKERNPGIRTIVTIPTTTSGPSWWGTRLIDQAAALQADIDVFTLMPFDFGSSDIYADTVRAVTALKDKLKATFGFSDAEAYAHAGISGMNGLSDQREVTSVETWTEIRDWAKANGLGRLAFWSVNRDRGGCDGQVASNCSGIPQEDWAFTRVTAGF